MQVVWLVELSRRLREGGVASFGSLCLSLFSFMVDFCSAHAAADAVLMLCAIELQEDQFFFFQKLQSSKRTNDQSKRGGDTNLGDVIYDRDEISLWAV